MLKKLFPALVLTLFITACEAPMDDTGTTNNESGAVTDGTGGSTNYGAGGVGSELQGMGGGELAPGVRDTVYFAVDSSTLDGEAQRVLAKQADYIKTSGIRVLVEGHCDERGTREYNLALGERRANAVQQYLLSQGVDAGKIEVISYGKERPLAEGSNEDAWAQNRRGVTIKR